MLGTAVLLPTTANGQPALALYMRGPSGEFSPFHLQVLALDAKISVDDNELDRRPNIAALRYVLEQAEIARQLAEALEPPLGSRRSTSG